MQCMIIIYLHCIYKFLFYFFRNNEANVEEQPENDIDSDVDQLNKNDSDEENIDLSAGNEGNEPSCSKKDAAVQVNDVLRDTLMQDILILQDKLQAALEKLKLVTFRYESIENEDLFKSLTGYSKSQFNVIFDFCKLEDSLSANCFLNQKNQLFLVLVYYRTGICQEFLAHLFQTTQPTVSKMCQKVTDTIYKKVKTVNIWPTKEKVQEKMPLAFHKLYPQCRVIIDCTELKIQRPTDSKMQQSTFSYYKNANTLKGMVGITPSGAISFISNLWGGSMSDKELFLRSNMLTLLEEKDLVLADRGFLISKELEKKGCSLITPHFLANNIQFTPTEKTDNKSVAHHRVHIERAIGRIKVFKYFEGALANCSLNTINKVFYILAFFINFGKPLFQPK